jgi:hypothetical protein
MNISSQEKINGYISLISVLPRYDRTSYPYSQLNQGNVNFTKNKIEILARKDDEYKSATTPEKTKSFDHDSRSKLKKGGYKSTANIVFYG